jgi:hypothetical protein
MLHPNRWFVARKLLRRNSIRPHLETLEPRTVPAVFNVNSLADLLTPPAGIVTLRSAIESANATAGGNTINLTLAGTYRITLAGTPGETDNAAGEFAILPTGGNLTIDNTSGGTAIIDGNHLNRVFDINPTPPAIAPFNVTFQGVTIQDGNAFDPVNPDGPTSTGGGIRSQANANVGLTNVILTNNVANADGGGVVLENVVNSTGTLTVTNSTISNNHSGDAGGGIDTDGMGTVTITNTVITGNTDINQGAGVYIDAIQVGTVFVSANATLTGTTVSNNQAINTGITASGGGISNAGNGIITISNSTVANNFSGGSGGGFSDENNAGTLIVSNSIFLNNSAVGSGGGIQEGGPSTTITNSLFQGNTSSATGGGLFLNGVAVSLQNNTLVGNTALGGGGGAEIQTSGIGTSATTITNSTFTGNSSTGNAAAGGTANGGGIDAPAAFTGLLSLLNDTINGNTATNGGGVFWAGTAGTIDVQNTILAHNFAGTGTDANNLAGSFTDNGGNLVGVTGAGSGNSGFVASTTQGGTVAVPLDPGLGPLQNNGGPTVGPTTTGALLTEALLTGSPALDKGVTSLAFPSPTTDQRGFTRPDTGTGENPDVGAFEFQDVTLSVSITRAAVTIPQGGSDKLTITVTNTGSNALPADNSAISVTLPSGLSVAAGTATTLTISPLPAGQSASFTLSVTGTTAGSQTVTATVVSPDTASVTNSATITVATALANSASFPIGFGNGANGVEAVVNLQANGQVVANPSPIPGFGGPITRATGDFNGDGVVDTVWAVASGGASRIRIIDGATHNVLADFFAFDPAFNGGVSVAVADVNGDGVPDLIVGAGPGGGPQVKVIDGTKLNQLQSNSEISDAALIATFFAYNPGFTSGVFVAAGDVNGDGHADVITGPGAGGGPEVKVIDGTKLSQLQANAEIAGTALLGDFFAFDPAFAGGVTVAAGDVNGDGLADVITGAGPGGGPQVKAIDATKLNLLQANAEIADSALIASFFAYNPAFTGGVTVDTANVNGQGRNDIVTGAGPGGGPQVEVFDATNQAVLASFFANTENFSGGVFV